MYANITAVKGLTCHVKRNLVTNLNEREESKMSVMLYKHGGKHKLHGDNFDYIVVDEEDVDSNLSKGWYTTTTEAAENKKSKRGRPPMKEVVSDLLGGNNVVDEERDN